MVFGEEVYSVLVVSSNSRFNDAITPLLPYSEYYRGLCAEMTPDVLETVLPETQRVKVAIES